MMANANCIIDKVILDFAQMQSIVSNGQPRCVRSYHVSNVANFRGIQNWTRIQILSLSPLAIYGKIENCPTVTHSWCSVEIFGVEFAQCGGMATRRLWQAEIRVALSPTLPLFASSKHLLLSLRLSFFAYMQKADVRHVLRAVTVYSHPSGCCTSCRLEMGNQQPQ